MHRKLDTGVFFFFSNHAYLVVAKRCLICPVNKNVKSGVARVLFVYILYIPREKIIL